MIEKPWILWEQDSWLEGGWGIAGQFDTCEEAIEAARALHAEWERNYGKEQCHHGCMVTSNAVFRLDVPTEEKA